MSSDVNSAANSTTLGAPAGSVTLAKACKCYHVYDRPQDRLKQALLLHRRKLYRARARCCNLWPAR